MTAAVYSLVRVINGRPATTSLIIAEGVGINHKSVIALVRKFQKDFEEFGLVAFETRARLPGKHGGGDVEFAQLNEDQATYLITLFRNTEIVRRFKIKLVKAFRQAINELTSLRALHAAPDWQQARIEGKAARRVETDTIQIFVEYAKSQGSGSPEKYYQALTKAANRSLFFVQGAVGKDFRAGLSAVQLTSLAMAEHIVERALLETMAGSAPYKAAYRLAADRVRQFATLIGQSVPGHSTTLLPGAQ